MPTLFLLGSAGPRSLPVLASFAAHAAIAVAAVGYGGRAPHRGSGPVQAEVEIESALVTLPVEAPPPEPPKTYADRVQSHGAAHSAHHTHPYPVAADHDEHAHSPLIDHRLEAAADTAGAAPRVEAAAAPAAPVFAMSLGQAAATGGTVSAGATALQGTGAGLAPAGAAEGDGPGHGADAVVPEAGVSQRARLVSALSPEYPAAARAQGLEAQVQLEIVVDGDGRVDTARVLRGAGDGFEDSALRAIHRARFSPALVRGRPVRVRMKWTVDFRLE